MKQKFKNQIMRTIIQLDQFGRGFIFWILDPTDDIGPRILARDPFGLHRIDATAEAELRRLLEIAAAGEWDADQLSASDLASRISTVISTLQATMPTLDGEPLIWSPKPLRDALGLPDGPVEVARWLEAYPADPQQN